MFQVVRPIRCFSSKWLGCKQAATEAQISALSALSKEWPSRADLVQGLGLDLLVAQSVAEQSAVIGAPIGPQFSLLPILPEREKEYLGRMKELSEIEFAIRNHEEVRLLANSGAHAALSFGAQMHLAGCLPEDVRPPMRQHVLERNLQLIRVLSELDELLNK